MKLKFKHIFERDSLFYASFIVFILFIILAVIEFISGMKLVSGSTAQNAGLVIIIASFLISLMRYAYAKLFFKAYRNNRTTAIVTDRRYNNRNVILYFKYRIDHQEYRKSVKMPSLSFAKAIDIDDQIPIIYDPKSRRIYVVYGIDGI